MTDIITTLISSAIAFLLGLLVNLQGRSQFFSTTVSKERMVWIKDVRKLCTELCTICEQNDAENLSSQSYTAFLKARNGILIRLSPAGWYTTDDELIELLQDPDFGTVKRNMPRIREILMTIIKNEWDKVKIEAGNNPWKVKRIRKIQNRLKSTKQYDAAHDNRTFHDA